VSQFVAISYRRPIFVSPEVELTFYDAGHILGSSLAVFDINDEGQQVRLAYSGDLGRKNKPILRDPDQIPDVDYLVLESTYGDRLHETTEGALETLASVVSHTAARNGKVVIPAFAVERTQEVVYFLHLLKDRGRIPKIPIYVDSPMATNATAIFKIHPECYDEETYKAFIDHHRNPFGFDELYYVQSVAESKKLNDLEGPAIIISSSGMCEAGRIQHHLLHTLSNPENTVLLVGFMAAHTVGRYIRDRKPQVRILGTTVTVRANVEEIGSLSAHADYEEMWDYVSKLDLKRLKKIFLVHGEEDALNAFSAFLKKKGIREVEIVAYGKNYTI
jgi:metallo-beta-lactamase family protein